MIPPRRHNPAEDGGTDSWLMSYADMITLLMCFFIIFVSVSEPKRDKFASLTKGMAEKFGMVDLSTPFHGVLNDLQGIIEHRNALKDVAIEGGEKGVEMELSASRFFQNGSSELSPEALPVLTEMATALKKTAFLKFRIAVEVHTNNIPFSTDSYASNWEFSAARAARMVRFLLEQGVAPETIKAVGYADSNPKVPNLDPQGKPIPENQQRNQRVVIRMERVD